MKKLDIDKDDINLVLDCEDNNLYVRDEIIGKQRELKIRKEEI